VESEKNKKKKQKINITNAFGGMEVMKEIVIKLPEFKDVVPKEFKLHMLRAYKEFLIAFKSIIEKRIEKIEKLEKELQEEKSIKKIEVQ